MRCSLQIRVSHGKAQTTPDLGSGGACLPGPQGKYIPVSQLGGLSFACDSPLLPTYPLGVGSNSSARFAGEEMGRERTHSFSHLQDVINSLNSRQISTRGVLGVGGAGDHLAMEPHMSGERQVSGGMALSSGDPPRGTEMCLLPKPR